MSHTPGPWFYKPVTEKRFSPITGIPHEPYVAHWIKTDNDKHVALTSGVAGNEAANAQLISAAPELLESLQDLIKTTGVSTAKGLAAIAKATERVS